MAKNVIRRRKNEKLREEQIQKEEKPTQVVKQAIPKRKPPSRPKLSENRLDGKSLLAELDALGKGGLDKLMGGRRLKRFSIGDEATGHITRIEKDILFIEIGAKSEGMIWNEDHDLKEPKIGDSVTATVVKIGSNGITLSASASGFTGDDAVISAFEANLPIDVKITGKNKGGYTLSVGGHKGFCPLSQMHKNPALNTEELVGSRVMVYITKVDHEFSASHRKWLEEEEAKTADQRFNELTEGELISGIVQGIESFGAFIDLGGVTGLLHQRHLKLLKPQPTLGSALQVKIGTIDAANQKISLLLGEDDPWNKLEKEFVIGDTFSASVTKLADYGLFVELYPGLIGLLHKSAISADHRYKPKDHYQLGQAVNVKLVDIDKVDRKISLELAAEGPKNIPKQPESVATLGDIFSRFDFIED